MAQKKESCLSNHCLDNHSCGSLYEEIVCHLPYGIFSVAMCFVVLSLLDYSSGSQVPSAMRNAGFNGLFHSFHFLHIVFATTGAVITFLRFSNRVIFGLIASVISAAFFCILSDVIMPYLSGKMLGVDVKLHICFYHELHNILPFMIGGLINGLAISKWQQFKQSYYSVCTHFLHVFISALASVFYIVANGLLDWMPYMGILFILLVIMVVLPCTMSDLVIPMLFARSKK